MGSQLKRVFQLGTLLIILMLALAACASDDDAASDDAGDDVDPAPTEAPVDTDDEATDDVAVADDTAADDTAVDDAAADDTEATGDDEDAEPAEGDAEPITLDPPTIVFSADGDEQEGSVGAFFWIHDASGLAAEAGQAYFEVPDEPLTVAEGDEIAIEIDFEDYDPYEMHVRVFDADEGEMDENRVTIDWEPVEEIELDEGADAWTADLEPGEYYIVLNTLWPTEGDWHRDQEVDYRFYISVE
jgi:hypothetical protein